MASEVSRPRLRDGAGIQRAYPIRVDHRGDLDDSVPRKVRYTAIVRRVHDEDAVAVLDDAIDDVDHLDPDVFVTRRKVGERNLAGVLRPAPLVGQPLPLFDAQLLLLHVVDPKPVFHRKPLGPSGVRVVQLLELRVELRPMV